MRRPTSSFPAGRIGDRAAEVDRPAVVKHRVAIPSAKLELLVGRRFGLGTEEQGERLVDMRGHRLAGDHAALLQCGDESAFGANQLAIPFERGMRLEPFDRAEAEPFGNRPPLSFVGHQVEAVAVADRIDPQVMGKAVRHPSFPSPSAVSSALSSFDHKRPSSAEAWRSPPAPLSPPYRLSRTASSHR